MMLLRRLGRIRLQRWSLLYNLGVLVWECQLGLTWDRVQHAGLLWQGRMNRDRPPHWPLQACADAGLGCRKALLHWPWDKWLLDIVLGRLHSCMRCA